jgi:hypothetical protein
MKTSPATLKEDTLIIEVMGSGKGKGTAGYSLCNLLQLTPHEIDGSDLRST